MSDPTAGAENTDRELWREREGDFYADSLFVTKEGGIGMNCGGYVVVMPIRLWHALAKRPAPAPPPAQQQAEREAAETMSPLVARAMARFWSKLDFYALQNVRNQLQNISGTGPTRAECGNPRYEASLALPPLEQVLARLEKAFEIAVPQPVEQARGEDK